MNYSTSRPGLLYEWDLEQMFINSQGDVECYDHAFEDVGRLNYLKDEQVQGWSKKIEKVSRDKWIGSVTWVELVLVRREVERWPNGAVDLGNGRSTASVTADGQLPDEFDCGNTVPKYLRKEFNKHIDWASKLGTLSGDKLIAIQREVEVQRVIDSFDGAVTKDEVEYVLYGSPIR